MKKIKGLWLPLFLCLFISSSVAFAETEDDYTLMIYMNGSSLESSYDYAKREFRGFATKDLQEMIDGYRGDQNINVIVQTGGTKKWNNDYVSNEETQRFLLTENGFELQYSLPLQNVGYKKGLSDFIIWTHRNYPADKYSLILWNHGGGPIYGYGLDENFNGDVLHLEELEGALKTAKEKTAINFDTIGFDACLMASIEIANTVSPYANYLIASEELEPSHGWDYKTILKELHIEPTMNGETFGKLVADSYLEHSEIIGESHNVTLSVTDLSKVAQVIEELNAFTSTLPEKFNDSVNFYTLAKSVASARSFGRNSVSQGYTELIDLQDFLSNIDQSIFGSTEALSNAIEEAVIYKVDGTSSKETSGLSIYYPLKDKKRYNSKFNLYSKTGFSETYINFLSNFTTKMTTLVGENSILHKIKPPNDQSDFYHIIFSESDFEKIATVYLEVTILNENDNDPNHSYRKLGFDNLIFLDRNNYFFNEQFEKEWIFFDDQPLLIQLMEINGESLLYESPVLYNDQEAYLQFRYDLVRNESVIDEETDSEDTNHYNYIIEGLKRPYDPSTGKPDKEVYQLKPGDTLAPLYKAYNDKRRKFEWTKGDTVNISTTHNITRKPLIADSYGIAFRYLDFSYQNKVTQTIFFKR